MEIKEIKKMENKFFDRKEVDFSLNDKTTPSKAALTAEIAKKLGVGEAVVIVKKVDQQYGAQDMIIHAFVYNSEESRKNFEKVKEKKKKDGAK